MIRFEPAAATDVGLVRAANEDGYLVTESLFAVADGMGGHRAGDVASSSALETLRTAVLLPSLEDFVAAVETANREVYELSLTDPELSGMGTTLCAVALLNGDEEDRQTCGIVNVGDSRVYVYTDGLHQLTEDHSLVESMVRSGQLTPTEAASHPGRNVLTRALGIEHEVLVDSWTVEVQPGDRFLLCSDGLVNEVSDDDIEMVLQRQPDPHAAAAELVRLALEAGGHDNITVVVVDVVDDHDAVRSRPIAERVARVSGVEEDAVDAELTAPAPLPSQAPPPARVPDEAPQDQARTGQQPSRVVNRRSVAFVGAVALVIAGAFGAVWYAARQTYFVGTDDGQVTVFRGRPGGLLWFDPILVERTDLAVSSLTEDQRDKLSGGHQVSSRSAADVFVDRLRSTAASSTTTAVPSTTASTTSTSLVGVIEPPPAPSG